MPDRSWRPGAATGGRGRPHRCVTGASQTRSETVLSSVITRRPDEIEAKGVSNRRAFIRMSASEDGRNLMSEQALLTRPDRTHGDPEVRRCYRHERGVWMAYCSDCTAWHLAALVARRDTEPSAIGGASVISVVESHNASEAA